MANIRKQFNFRNGVQVDDNNLVVSPLGLVGIGTTIPTESLDVRGNAKVVGLASVNQIYTPDLTATIATVEDLSINNSIVGAGISVSSGIVTASGVGVVTYYGDGGRLSNLPSSQWLDVDAGLGFTSIYAQGYVGVGTVDPRFLFQISGNPNPSLVGFTSGIGFSQEGNILATGIATAYKFSGIGSNLTGLNASSIAYGTISNDRIPVLLNSKIPSNINISGIITASGGFIGTVSGNLYGNLTGNVTGNVVGDVVGIASTARFLTGTPDITVGNILASAIDFSNHTSGIATLPNTINIGYGGSVATIRDGYLGIGTALPTSLIQLRNSGLADIELVSETGETRITLGQIGSGSSTGIIRFGNSVGALEFVNRDVGNINTYLHSGSAGINTGRFDWIYGQNNQELMSLTYEGRLGVGKTDPETTLHVIGDSTITGNTSIGGNLTVSGSFNALSITLPPIFDGNVNSTSGISTFFNVGISSVLTVLNRIGINSLSPKSYLSLDVTDGEASLGSVGVGTTSNGSSFRVEGPSVLTTVSIGNTFLSDGYGLSLHDTTSLLTLTDIEGSNNTSIALDNTCSVGVGTDLNRCAVDFGDAGKGYSAGAEAYMVIPKLTNAQRLGLSTISGAFIFNLDTLKFQGYTGSAWVDFN